MPASRSPKRTTEIAREAPRPRPFPIWPLILIGIVAVLAVMIAAAPASLASHFLPPNVRTDELSGTLRHGVAGNVSVDGRSVGAVEWQLHLSSLLRMSVVADLHWVKSSSVVDGTVELKRANFVAHDVRGAGSVQDLRDFGIPAGWQGTFNADLREIKGSYGALPAAVGQIALAHLMSPQVAEGTDLGSYVLTLPGAATPGEAGLMAELRDTAGPLDVQAEIRFSAAEHTGLLSGTVKERADASPALRRQLDDLAQLRGRDKQGRVPVDLEFTL